MCINRACRVAVPVGFLRYTLWFDVAAESSSGDQDMFDPCVVPFDRSLGRW